MESSTKQPLHVTVVTPARSVFDAEAASVVVPAFDGELGVMPGHAAMLALLGVGVMRVTTPAGAVNRFAIRGGFLQINHNRVTVLTPESIAGVDVKPQDIQAEAEKMSAEKPLKLEERDELETRREWLKAREKAKS